jgi:hypothetical protein
MNLVKTELDLETANVPSRCGFADACEMAVALRLWRKTVIETCSFASRS